jgi:hypothetical protein
VEWKNWCPKSKCFLGENKTEQEYYNTAKANMMFWRLVFDGNMSLSEVKKLDIDEVNEANAALNIHIQNQNKANS